MIALPSTALLEKFRTLKPGNHICLIYENEEEWQEAVSAFLISGLEKNEKCICMVRKHTPEQVLMYLKARGLDITSDSIKKQLLIININSSPELKNSLNPETITALLGRESLQARSEGYAALRFTGEIGWMLGHSTQNLDKILHHVGVLNRDLFPNFRCVAMFRCFNKRYSNHTINEIVMAYPIYIKNNKIHYNTYCRLPHDLLENLEKELQEQLYFLQNLIDAIPNPVFFKGFDGKYQRCNRAFEGVMGRPKEKIIGHTFKELAPGELSESGWEMDQKLFQTKGVQLYDGVLPYADGTIHDVIYNKATVCNMADELIGLVGVTVDITERKRAEKALALSEEKFRNIFRQSPIGIALINEEGILIDANQACLEIYGVNHLEDITGFMLFDDPNLPEEAKQDLKEGQIVRYQGEFSFDKVRENQLYPSKKPGVAYLDYLITPMLSQYDGIKSFLIQIQDITEQKSAAVALQRSETQLRRITTNMLDIICETDRNGNIIYISPSCKTVLGYEPEEALGHNVSEGTHPDDLKKVKAEGKRAVRSGSYGKIEFRYRHKNGEWVWLETIGNTLWNERGRMAGVVFVTRDISKRKQLEKEMVRLDRLRLAGEIAASMGHEIRNPMTTVQGFLQLLKDEPGCEPYCSYFDLMIDELKAANDIITEFISMAQHKAIYLQVQDINAIVSNLYPLIAAEGLKSDKQVKLDLGDIPPINIDANEIRQLLLNLTLNGLEAMQAGGNLFIRTFLEDNKVVLAVEDQGSGIDPSVYDKLGTPFVTTKETGTGLGLAICYSIAARHNATMGVDTGPKGTTFKVAFKINHKEKFSFPLVSVGN